MIELEIDGKRLNYNENLKFMPFGKSFHFYAIWELFHLGSYLLKYLFETGLKLVFKSNERSEYIGLNDFFFQESL